MNLYEARYLVGHKHKSMYFLANNLDEAIAEAKLIHPKQPLVGAMIVVENVYFDLARLIKNAEDFAKV
jgi:hypothetical protein